MHAGSRDGAAATMTVTSSRCIASDQGSRGLSLGALWPLTENFRGATRNFRGTHCKSTCHPNIHISTNFHCITNKYIDNRCRNNVLFHGFTGVRPLVVPLDRTLRLVSARSPIHWECIIRRDKRLPCEKPFMAPEAEPCTCSGTRTIWIRRVKNDVLCRTRVRVGSAPEQRRSVAGFANVSETSLVLDMLFRSGGAN